jgi:hypothetical protein
MDKKEGEAKKSPTPNQPANIIQGDITRDSFFDDSLDDVDLDSLGSVGFTKLSEDTQEDIEEVLKGDLELSPKRNSFASEALETGTVLSKNTKSEGKEMANTDPNKEKIEAMWDSFAESDDTDYKLMVHRLGPQVLRGVKIAGYLETFYVPCTIPDIIEQIGRKYGGGRYVIKVVDNAGRYVKSKQFEIAGLPRFPDEEKKEESPPAAVAAPAPTVSLEEDDDEEEEAPRIRRPFRRRVSSLEEEDDMEEEEEEATPRFTRQRRISPRNQGFGNQGFGNPGFGNQGFGNPGFGNPGFAPARGGPAEDLSKVKREMEEKLTEKLDTKLGAFSNQISNLANQLMSKPAAAPANSLLTPDLLQAALPLVGSLLESRGAKDNVMASQFSEVNGRMANLFQTLQESHRLDERSREDLAEKERLEREQARKEWIETQAKIEERHREESRKQEERFQMMMSKMTESLEQRFNGELTSVQKAMQAQEAAREESRRREDAAREEARRREEEFKAKMAQEERQFREMMAQKETEARQRYEEMQARLRQSELKAERETRQRELEVLERMKASEIEKFQMAQEMQQKNFTNNMGTKDYELKMQMALQKLHSERDSEMQELRSRLALEELANKQQLQLVKLEATTQSKGEGGDPFDKIMEEYMRKRVMIMMARELEGVEMEEDDTPASMKDMLGSVLKSGADALGPLLTGMLNPQAGAPRAPQGRTVFPNPSAPPQQPTAAHPHGPGPSPQQQQQQQHQQRQQQERPAPTLEPENMSESEEAEDGDEDIVDVEGFDFSGIDLNSLSMSMFNPEMIEEIEKITAYFDYLRDSIEANGDPKEAAEVANGNLLPAIVDYISSIEESRVIIMDLEMLLDANNPELKPFLLQEASLAWLDKMLSHLKEIRNG